MGKIKHTKTELKRQRDNLRRFQRYLPTLQLKKQQLQLEIRRIEALIEARQAEEERLRQGLELWMALFSEPCEFPTWQVEEPFRWEEHLRVVDIRTREGNIAGVPIPLFEEVVWEKRVPDLFGTPPWVDDALAALERLISLGAELAVLREQQRRVREELRVTTQRVNLFEKVKIPECQQNIRVIRIFLGDQQTAEVARAKLAKGRLVAGERAA